MVSATSSDGQAPSQPRPPLRINASRHSMTGAGAVSSPKAASQLGSPALARSSSTRVSSPGQLQPLNAAGSPGSSPLAVAVAGAAAASSSSPASTSPGFGGLGPVNGDLPRLPCVSESGEKNGMRPPGPNPLLRRASTMMTMNVGGVGRNSLDGPPLMHAGSSNSTNGGSGNKDMDTDSTFSLKKERNALRMDKNVLLLNKRRLEGLITKVLEVPLLGEDESPSGPASGSSAGGGGGGGGGQGAVFASNGARASLVRASNLRAHLMQALDESVGLDKQLASTGGGGAALQPIPAFGGDPHQESAVRALEARIAQMQADHEVALKHMESELSYRRTQAAAANQGAQRQLAEAVVELAELKRKLEAAEDQVQTYYQQNSELKLQVQTLESGLADRNRELANVKDMLGMDKSTMNTVINMLKDQLQDANADRAHKAQQMAELEYAIVHRDALLSEAHERINQAAAQAAAAVSSAVSSSAAVARIAASMPGPLDSKSSWGHMRTSTNGGGGSPLGSATPSLSAPLDLKGSSGGHPRPSLNGGGKVTGNGNGNGGGGGVTTSLTAHHSHRRIVASRGTPTAQRISGGGANGGHMSDAESYSGDRFETEEYED